MASNMKDKKQYDFKSAFDDRNLPVNDLSTERIEEIEKIAMPRIKQILEKLRKEKPDLFQSTPTGSSK